MYLLRLLSTCTLFVVNRLQVLNEWLNEFAFEVRPLNIHSGNHDTLDKWLEEVVTDLQDVLQRTSSICLMGYSSGGILVHYLYDELMRRQIEVAGVVLLDPTSGQPEEMRSTLERAISASSIDELQVDPMSLLILASAATDDPIAAARSHGLVGLQQKLLQLMPNMQARLAGAARSTRWLSVLQSSESEPQKFECPVLLVSCSDEHPMFRGITGPDFHGLLLPNGSASH